MPIYEFVCGQCGARFEHLARRAAEKAPKCPKCGAPGPRKQFSTFSALRSGDQRLSPCSEGVCPMSGRRGRTCGPGSCPVD